MAAKLSGSGGGKYTVEANAEINVTPFVDIMLVLLIIFMVAAPLATVSVPVTLPRAVAPPAVKRTRAIARGWLKEALKLVEPEPLAGAWHAGIQSRATSPTL